MESPEKNNIRQNAIVVYFTLSFRQLCLVTVSLPLVALFICFVTAYIFQPDDIHETHCRVYNIIPSISAVTGISPQRYLWRICIALHIGPRFIIASVYRTYHRSLAKAKADSSLLPKAFWWFDVSYWLNMTEVAALCGVTYISNRENYPIHEKIFIVFMISSLTHMLASIKSIQFLKKLDSSNLEVSHGLFFKQVLFVTSLISTVGLVIFFLKHRLLCHDMAFSWFAFCEYVIASANMAFHITVVLDFPTEQLVVCNRLSEDSASSPPVGWKLD